MRLLLCSIQPQTQIICYKMSTAGIYIATKKFDCEKWENKNNKAKIEYAIQAIQAEVKK